MIVLLIAMAGCAIWTGLFWTGLKRLRRERVSAERTWQGDLYRAARNKRAIALFALWSAVMVLTFNSIIYVDVGFTELSRFVGVTERIVLLVCGLWIWVGPGEKV